MVILSCKASITKRTCLHNALSHGLHIMNIVIERCTVDTNLWEGQSPRPSHDNNWEDWSAAPGGQSKTLSCNHLAVNASGVQTGLV